MVSRGIPRICCGEPRNLANGAAEFGKICRGKLWSLLMVVADYIQGSKVENSVKIFVQILLAER